MTASSDPVFQHKIGIDSCDGFDFAAALEFVLIARALQADLILRMKDSEHWVS